MFVSQILHTCVATGMFRRAKASAVGNLSWKTRHATIPTFLGTQLHHSKVETGNVLVASKIQSFTLRTEKPISPPVDQVQESTPGDKVTSDSKEIRSAYCTCSSTENETRFRSQQNCSCCLDGRRRSDTTQTRFFSKANNKGNVLCKISSETHQSYENKTL
ncbi:hypothetical protein HanRHA438_Chr09g0392611 [Helianthus annuus]|nr:hypothetical protein HanHA300_Chr09g0312701 [Helianthus annuus]KAJ0533638.1 hypothetical protein HanIR_Chr09g0410691 [Helianthus annuus]KAJ0541881.1 hypothetical protein HanHA89_Chr09g0333611 [Helianthus annuus]KAJ0706956.1 hypothetical protein HanLR1_Chr09g0313061 [Helianthus annuus]KAJ0710976.1 hypothetical protein HanOQP8_Chr09g0318641 [Helianthus annuus]